MCGRVWVNWGVVCLALVGAVGCGSSDAASAKAPPSGSFAVSDYFVPAAVLQGAPGHVITHINDGCMTRPAAALGDCYRFDFQEASLGALWQYPAGNFGDAPGLALPSGLTKVSFWAAVTGGEVAMPSFEFGAGYPVPDVAYPDTFAVTNDVKLSAEWQYFEVALPQPAPTSLVMAFKFDSYVTSGERFYLDDLVYE